MVNLWHNDALFGSPNKKDDYSIEYTYVLGSVLEPPSLWKPPLRFQGSRAEAYDRPKAA